jgi:hypothetical protein
MEMIMNQSKFLNGDIMGCQGDDEMGSFKKRPGRGTLPVFIFHYI